MKEIDFMCHDKTFLDDTQRRSRLRGEMHTHLMGRILAFNVHMIDALEGIHGDWSLLFGRQLPFLDRRRRVGCAPELLSIASNQRRYFWWRQIPRVRTNVTLYFLPSGSCVNFGTIFPQSRYEVRYCLASCVVQVVGVVICVFYCHNECHVDHCSV
jgi:hypothetical protein